MWTGVVEMLGVDGNLVVRNKCLPNDKGAVFLSSLDGILKSVNQAAAKLIDENKSIESLLPKDHCGLVRACLQTKLGLERQCEFNGRKYFWSYQASDSSNFAYIYGSGFSVNEVPVKHIDCISDELTSALAMYSRDGDLQSFNPKFSELLSDLKLEDAESVLPFNHAELISACIKGKLALSEGRYIDGSTYVWTYESTPETDEVKVYARDLSIQKDENTGKRDLEFLSDGLGAAKFINFATYKLLNELGVTGVDEILSTRHKGLIKACLFTNTSLTEKCRLSNRSITWTYHPHEDGENVKVYGYENE